jgi:molecular chaperone DnaK (HSP70)
MGMPSPGYQLGIDYGTSNTVAVLRWPNGRVRPLLFDGFPLLPSAVFANPDGSIVSGRDAVRSASLAPASYEPHVKRRIDELDLLLGDRVVPVVGLIAATLRRVYAEAVQAAGAQPATVCLSAARR